MTKRKLIVIIVDSFSRLIAVHPSGSADAPETVILIEKYLTSFGVQQQLKHDKGIEFLTNDFVQQTHKIRIKIKLQSSNSTWTNGNGEVLNTKMQSFVNDIGSNWANLTSRFAFFNIAKNNSTENTPCKIVVGI